MKTAPFILAPAGAAEPVAWSVRLPYHDNPDCPEGQRLRRSGHWRPYEPTSIAETRPRCPVCRSLDAAPA